MKHLIVFCPKKKKIESPSISTSNMYMAYQFDVQYEWFVGI